MDIAMICVGAYDMRGCLRVPTSRRHTEKALIILGLSAAHGRKLPAEVIGGEKIGVGTASLCCFFCGGMRGSGWGWDHLWGTRGCCMALAWGCVWGRQGGMGDARMGDAREMRGEDVGRY